MGSSIYIFAHIDIGIIFLPENSYTQGTGKFGNRSFKFSGFLHCTDVNTSA